MINNGEIGVPNRFHLGKNAWAFYAQDSWKITPKLTLDYGLRWDYQTYLQETYGRAASWDPNLPNPSYGNIKGAPIFPKRQCQCLSAWVGAAIGIGVSIHAQRQCFARASAISYGQTGALEMWNLRMGSFVRYGPSGTWGDPIGLLKNGPNVNGTPVVPVWPNYRSGTGAGCCRFRFHALDRFPGRAAAATDTMEYRDSAGNHSKHKRGGFLCRQPRVPGGIPMEPLPIPTRVTPEILAAHNFDLNNADDRALLITPLSSVSAADKAKYKLTVPFTGFAGNVNQSIRPFPHVGNLFVIWAPLGRTWYDSLQMKLTKRFSHGLDLTGTYSWQKELTIGAETLILPSRPSCRQSTISTSTIPAKRFPVFPSRIVL